MSDPLRVLAGGVGTLDNDDTLLERLAGLVEEHRVMLVVVGMPYAPDGGREQRRGRWKCSSAGWKVRMSRDDYHVG